MIYQDGDHFAPGPDGFERPNLYRIPPVEAAMLARTLSVVGITPQDGAGDMIMQAARTRQRTAVDACVAIILHSQRATHHAAYSLAIEQAHRHRWPILAYGMAVRAKERASR